MKTFYSQVLVGVGVLILFFVVFYRMVSLLLDSGQDVSGIVTVMVSDQNETKYNVKIKNPFVTPIRYKVETPFPVMVEPKQEATIIVSLSSREKDLSETELILYADGKELTGLTPVKIKLPAMSHQVP